MTKPGTLGLGTIATGLALALAAALLALLATPQAEAASRFKTVTKTFSSTQGIAVNHLGAASPYPSEISVAGLKRGKIRDANLALKGFGHTFPADVDVMLSHRGANRLVMSDVGYQNDVSGVDLVLDDEAAAPLPTSQLATGTFQPTNVNSYPTDAFPAPAPAPSGLPELSGFDGLNPNGRWQLLIVDDSGGDYGQFSGGWSVTIKARVLR